MADLANRPIARTFTLFFRLWVPPVLCHCLATWVRSGGPNTVPRPPFQDPILAGGAWLGAAGTGWRGAVRDGWGLLALHAEVKRKVWGSLSGGSGAFWGAQAQKKINIARFAAGSRVSYTYFLSCNSDQPLGPHHHGPGFTGSQGRSRGGHVPGRGTFARKYLKIVAKKAAYGSEYVALSAAVVV